MLTFQLHLLAIHINKQLSTCIFKSLYVLKRVFLYVGQYIDLNDLGR